MTKLNRIIFIVLRNLTKFYAIRITQPEVITNWLLEFLYWIFYIEIGGLRLGPVIFYLY